MPSDFWKIVRRPILPIRKTFRSSRCHYFELGDVVAAKYWSEAALKVDSRAPAAKLVLALLHLDRHEEAEATEIAREITQPGALAKWCPGSCPTHRERTEIWLRAITKKSSPSTSQTTLN